MPGSHATEMVGGALSVLGYASSVSHQALFPRPPQLSEQTQELSGLRSRFLPPHLDSSPEPATHEQH